MLILRLKSIFIDSYTYYSLQKNTLNVKCININSFKDIFIIVTYRSDEANVQCEQITNSEFYWTTRQLTQEEF